MTPVSYRVSIGGDVWQCQNCACIIFSAQHSDEAGDRYMDLIDDAVEMFEKSEFIDSDKLYRLK